MLIQFELKNWASFKDAASLSTIASKERQHGERVPKIDKYQTRILPITAIYGANASGKTNFFKALNFARNLIVRGTQVGGMIPVDTFRLDASCLDAPSSFRFELLIDDVIYEYSFTVTRTKVIEEKLVQILSAAEKVLFHRKNGKPHFDKSLLKDEFLHFAFKGTRDNQLFLTNSVSQKVKRFQPVYEWFQDTLVMIAPDSRFEPFEQFISESSPLFETMNQKLRELDTGIMRLGTEAVSLNNLSLPEALKIKLEEEVKEGQDVRVILPSGENRIVVSRKKGELIAKKLVACHAQSDGSEAKFDMGQESDGSRRVIDLLPAFLGLMGQQSKKVVVIDEIDRSLHPLLTRRLLESYLNSCTTKTRTQLLLTTHDVLLMDQNLLRRDEMWVVERDKDGASLLCPFSDYHDIRYDKDIRKSYLQGRLGGIPHLQYPVMAGGE